MNTTETFDAFSGLDLLSSAVVLVDAKLIIRHINPAAENLFAVSSRQLLGHPLQRLVGETAELSGALDNALKNNWSYTGHNILIELAETSPVWFELHPQDGFFVPPGTRYRAFNMGGEPTEYLFGVAPLYHPER